MWNDPGNYGSGFDTCAADTVAMPPGEYKLKNGKTSTWHQGVNPTPAGQKPAKSSQCVKQATILAAKYATSKPASKPTTTKKPTTSAFSDSPPTPLKREANCTRLVRGE